MKKLYILTAFFLTVSISFGQCPNSDIVLSTQAEIDNFAANYPNCSALTNQLDIDGVDSDITNLDGLSGIVSAQNLFIRYTQISDFNGLHNLESMAYCSIWGNPNLQSMAGLTSLQTAAGLEVWINGSITDMSGMDNLESIGVLNLFENANLSDISQLSFIDALVFLSIGGNNLTTLAGLENLETVVEDVIISNEPLQDLSELSNVQTIGGSLYISNNSELTDISALSNITSLVNLHLTDSPDLGSLNGLQNIQSISGRLRIGYNSQITDLDIFSNLTLVGDIDIYDNHNLESLTGLENVLQVAHRLLLINNPILTDIEALNNISAAQLDELVVANNSSLSICNNQFICEVVNNIDIIKSITNNGAGCSSVEEIQEMCLLGMDEISLSNSIELYPNPVSDLLHIAMSGNVLFEKATLRSILGQQILETRQENVPLSHLSDGIYIVTVRTNLGSISKKIVKQ